MKKLKENFGFTMVEMIISIVILGIMGLMTFSFIGNTTEIYGITTAQARLNDQLWVTMEKISRELESVNPAFVTLAGTDVDTDGITEFTEITFTKPACGTCVDTSTIITYRLTGNILERTGNLLGGNYYIVADNISLPTDPTNPTNLLDLFSNPSANIFTIQMTKSETINNNTISITLSTSVYPNTDFEEVIY